jgi:hypothetical protein
MKTMVAMSLLALLALVIGSTAPVSAQQITVPFVGECEIDFNDLLAADIANVPPEFRRSFTTPENPDLGDLAEKKCTFSAPDQTIQIRCVRVIEDWEDAPTFEAKNFTEPCQILGHPECGFVQSFDADNQTLSVSDGPDGAIASLFCLRNKR